MNWKHLRAGERRKLAKNLNYNVTARRIGVLGFCLARMLTPVLVMLGLSALAFAIQQHEHVHAGMALAASAGLVPGGRDFLDMMDEGDKMETSLCHRSKMISKFDEKLDRFIGLIANKEDYAPHKRAFLMKEAETTSDFPILFGTVLERQLIAKYAIADADWRKFIKVGTQNDFRLNNLIGVYGIESLMKQVAERGAYENDKLADGKVANQLFKYGRQFLLSWETIINDDLGAFSDIAQRLANAAMATENFLATQLYVDVNGPLASFFGAAIVHPIDGASINNVTTAKLAIDALGNAITALRSQVDINGNPIIITRFHLVVPPALEIPALKILSQSALIAGASTVAVVTSENIVAKLPITLHVNPYIPLIAKSNPSLPWWVFGENAGNTPAVQMNFLRGHESPEIVQKAGNKISLGGGAVSALDGDFDHDSMAWRIRHVLGGTQVDPRFGYASSGSA